MNNSDNKKIIFPPFHYERRIQMEKKNNKKGFTLAELLIVVAIIAVLVAIAIPIFTSQLEKSREATDLSNVRAAYAEVMSAALTGDTTPDTSTGVTYSSGTWSKTVTPLKQQQNEWQTDMTNVEVGGVKYVSAWDSVTKGGKGTVSYDGTTVSITWE